MSHTIPSNIVDAARSAQSRYGIPASVSLAQWVLESGRGRHMPEGSNNPFGIKSVKGQPSVLVRTREVIHGKSVDINAGFRKFPSISDAFVEHARLLAEGHPYAHARSLLPDVLAFCDALTGVYATDPNYGKLLKSIIASDNLTQYDK